MSDVIRLLPETIANQIAAGEVAPAPSYVVKELLENSIDAGATSIQLEVADGGKAYIHVIDNGRGMSPTDARMAFEKHATSKISTADDLGRLVTMGFRGEALAAIAAIAQVELRTRTASRDLGTELFISGSQVQSVQPCVTPSGTSIRVKDIFFNTPARRRFLKSNDREYKAIITEFERVALVNPQVAMSLYKDGNLSIDLPAAGLKERILRLGGKRLEKDLLPINYESSTLTIQGYVGKPTGARKSGAQQFFFVNNRFMKHPYFHKAISLAYENLIPMGHQPNYFIYFTLPPENIDVNINPTKTEIRFVDEQFIWQMIKSLVREALSAHAAVPIIDFDNPSIVEIPTYTGRKEQIPNPSPSISNNATNASASYGRRVFIGPNNSIPPIPSPMPSPQSNSYDLDWEELGASFEAAGGASSANPQNREESLELFDHKEMNTAQEANPSGYFIYKGRYIVTSLRRNIALIDYQRAYIRILYERYLQDLACSSLESQQVMFPDSLSLSSQEESLAREVFPELSALGFSFDETGENEYTITMAPSCIANEAAEIVRSMLTDCLETGEAGGEYLTEHLAILMAQTNACQSTRPQDRRSVDDLLAKLFASTDPNLTPMGDRIIITLSEADLDQRFG
ncbi:MAG: DNA mismatch repair endonuclease MutL [Porphyromonadaceae bacterium]|nr:DNA mismatch repair endonuclease MutL [Porphyromonadaceae bacterium]